MKLTRKKLFTFFILLLMIPVWSCSTLPEENSGDNPAPPSGPDSDDPNSLGEDFSVNFTPVGENIAQGLTDLEFLPGQNGHSLAITKGGNVYYLDKNFSVIGNPFFISTKQDHAEKGLLNVVADPRYATNSLVYFYYTDPDDNPDRHLVERYQVNVNIPGDTFNLLDPQLIIDFTKTGAANENNGGALVFMTQDELAIGVGDGGDSPQLALNVDSPLGKVHRIIPNRTPGAGGFVDPGNGVSNVVNSVYSIGLQNPFSIVVDGDGDLFLGDVSQDNFEEINCVYYSGENYHWPDCEGPCGLDPINPVHGYAFNDDDFDPDFILGQPKFIILSAYYLGDQYDGAFTDKIIYNELNDGFVRVITLNQFEQVIADAHIGYQPGLTGLQENPADGLLYGVSLSDSNRVLRMDFSP